LAKAFEGATGLNRHQALLLRVLVDDAATANFFDARRKSASTMFVEMEFSRLRNRKQFSHLIFYVTFLSFSFVLHEGPQIPFFLFETKLRFENNAHNRFS
jgi:hypothetical protein